MLKSTRTIAWIVIVAVGGLYEFARPALGFAGPGVRFDAAYWSGIALLSHWAISAALSRR